MMRDGERPCNNAFTKSLLVCLVEGERQENPTE